MNINNSLGDKPKFGFDTSENIMDMAKQYEKKKDAFIPKNISSTKGLNNNIPDKNETKDKQHNNKSKNKGFSQSKLSDNYKNIETNKQSSNQNNLVQKHENKPQQPSIIDDEDDDIEKVVFGINEKGQKIYIPECSRFFNTLVLGGKASGKTTGILPLMLEQDFKNKNYGATIIVSKNETAYNLYALAKQYKRDVILLKPSINNEISNKFLWRKDYDYDYINEYIINYKEAIKKKQIVIIDMEILKHKSDGLKAVAMLLLQLQLDIQETDITQKKPHFLYVDDGQYYLPFLEYLFAFGDNYNLGITLFLQSRSQLYKNDKNYTNMIDNNIRNILLLNALDKNDITYYKDRLYEYKQLNQFYNRELTEILYETLNSDNKRKCGLADYNALQSIDWENINNKAKGIRSKLLKQKRKELEKEILQNIKNKISGNENYDQYYIEENYTEMNEDENNSVSEIEKELIETLPPEEFDDNYDDICEPTPIDIRLIDNKEVKNISDNINSNNLDDIQEHIKTLKKDLPSNKEQAEKKAEIKKEKLQEIIRIKEKSTKRKVSTKIFNNIVSEIDYCDDKFDFNFD